MGRVAVAGGGMAGLAMALFSARRGHEVVVVDRDPGPPEGGPHKVATWERRGVAQARFSHYFLARSTRIVREEAPELIDRLAAAGIGPSSATFGPGYEDDAALTARRPVYESVLRRFVDEQPGVTMVQGSVSRLLVGPRHPERIVGMALADGTEVTADLVVDAGGRRSASGRWLRELGLEPPAVEEESCERHYYCRHYRLRDGEDYPVRDVPVVQPLPYATILIFIGDNRTFSVATSLLAADPSVRTLQDPEVFDRFLRAVPLSAGWLDRAEPVSDLHLMAGLSNRRRRLVVDGAPVASGIAVVGDASQYTNPALGQGVSLTFWMAQHLAAMVERVADHPAAAAVAYESWVDDELGPRFERQLRADRLATRQLEVGVRGEGFLPPADDTAQYLEALSALRGQDEEIGHLVNRVGHLLDRPSAYWNDPDIVTRVEAFAKTAKSTAGTDGPLPREAFEELVGTD